jgi:aspartyl/glutamyl-tRNA(Asn/Gln) amidotransferase C subunit
MIQNVAKIAKITIAKSELANFEESVKKVVDWVSLVKSLDVSSAKPMFHVTRPTKLEYRSNDVDIVASDKIALLSNNPDSQNGFFVTKLVVS